MQEKIRVQQLQCQLDTSNRTLEHSRTEITTLKQANEELVQKSKEKSTATSSSSTTASAAASKAGGGSPTRGDSLPPTLELGREVLAVKDRLVELERQNAVLLAEKDNLTAQVE